MIQKGTNLLKEHSKNRLVYDGNLQQINFLDRRVYKRDENTYYPSVTTILQYLPKAKFFEQWLKDVGNNADYIMKRAGEEGTQVHEAVEALINGEEINWMDDFGNARYSQLVWEMINKFVEFWKETKPEIIATEQFVYSDEFKFAGTTDLVVKLNGQVWLLDIKTSNSLHTSYNLQLSAYAKAWDESYDDKIEETGVLWLKSSKRSSKEGKLQGKGWEVVQGDKSIDEYFTMFKNIYDIYLLENPNQKPLFESYPTSVKLG